MINKDFTFNRVLGLKFLYDYFPYLFNKNRIELYFVNSKKELLNLKLDEKFDTYVLKRSGNSRTSFISDIKCKDNRFFDSLQELKDGTSEFDDVFDFCVECHKFRKSENYYSDKLAIAQFSTCTLSDCCDKISFIPSKVPGVSTRDNEPYLVIEFPSSFGNIFHINKYEREKASQHGYGDYEIAFLIKEIHKMIDPIRELLLELEIYNNFQLIIRIDSYLNLLPIDFRTPEAWASIKN